VSTSSSPGTLRGAVTEAPLAELLQDFLRVAHETCRFPHWAAAILTTFAFGTVLALIANCTRDTLDLQDLPDAPLGPAGGAVWVLVQEVSATFELFTVQLAGEL